jgi:hypothetical protein
MGLEPVERAQRPKALRFCRSGGSRSEHRDDIAAIDLLRTKNRNCRKRRESTKLCSIPEQSSREPVSELALWIVLLYQVQEPYEFVTVQLRHVFLAETFAIFP